MIIKTKYKVMILVLVLLILSTSVLMVKSFNESSKYESKSETLSIQLKATEEQVNTLENRIDSLKEANKNFENGIKNLTDKNKSLKATIESLETTIDDRSEEIKSLETKIFDEKYNELKSLDALTDHDFVDVGQIDPLIRQDKYFLYNTIYDAEGHQIIGQQHDVMALRYGTAKKLKLANSLLNAKGYGIIMYEAYRSYDMQAKLNDHYNFLNDTDEGDRTYIAYPGSSKHQKGIAVDIGLYSLTTNEILPMPTDYLVLDETANVNQYMTQEHEAAQNLKILQRAMKQAGFSIYAGEWWHFNDLTLVEEVEPYQGNIYDVLIGIK